MFRIRVRGLGFKVSTRISIRFCTISGSETVKEPALRSQGLSGFRGCFRVRVLKAPSLLTQRLASKALSAPE